MVLEKSHIIKLYKVTKDRRCEKPLFTHTHCTVNDNNNPQCFAIFFYVFEFLL